jgi:hypothetical protein
MRRGDLFDAALEEVERVRAELGYPIMVTPLSQFVATQAVMNLLAPERYANVPDEVVRMVLGQFGEPAAPPDPDVLERILSHPRARELRDVEPLSLEGARERFGAHISRRGAAAAPDDAGRAGRRDALRRRRRRARRRRDAAAPGAPIGATPPSSRCCASSRRARRCARSRCAPARNCCGGGVALADAAGFMLDLDGTLVQRAPDGVVALPGAAELIGAIRASGRPLVVFTNASHTDPGSIARGRATAASSSPTRRC